jgi:ankyrin repeat protein
MLCAAALLWLGQHGANVHALKQDGWQDTALHYAASRGCLDSCKVLLAYGASLKARNFAGKPSFAFVAKLS